MIVCTFNCKEIARLSRFRDHGEDKLGQGHNGVLMIDVTIDGAVIDATIDGVALPIS
jgi:hypothetical protein